MKFAFLIMGNFDMTMDRATIHGGNAQMIGVSDMAFREKTWRELNL